MAAAFKRGGTAAAGRSNAAALESGSYGCRTP